MASTATGRSKAALVGMPASQDQVSYGAQMYDCAVGRGPPAPPNLRGMAAQIQAVTAGGRTCSNPTACLALLAANEDIDYDGATAASPSTRTAIWHGPDHDAAGRRKTTLQK